MKTRIKRLDVKASGDPIEGVFEGYASVFGNIDSYGDKVVKGAFTDSLKELSDAGIPGPVYYSHQMGGDPLMNIGVVLEVKEDDRGLWVKCQLDIEDNDKAAYVHKLLREKRLTQMSFAYDVLEGAFVEKEDEAYYELRKLKLFEVSVVPVGANQETSIELVKAALAGVKDDAEPAPEPGEDDPGEDEVDMVDLQAFAQSFADVLSEFQTSIGTTLEALSGLLDSSDDESDDDGGDAADEAGDDSGDGEKRRKSLLTRLNLDNALRGGKGA